MNIFEIQQTSKDTWLFHLLNGDKEIIATSGKYNSKEEAQEGIEEVETLLNGALVVHDNTGE